MTPSDRTPTDDWTDLDELTLELDVDEPVVVVDEGRAPIVDHRPREPVVVRRPGPPPRHPAPRRPPARPAGGVQPAGAVLLTMVLGLALAALINADALVARAERKPLGTGRDRSLMIWHPVQDLSHVLQLHRIRSLGDDLAGNEERGDQDAFAEHRPSEEPAPADPRPVLRRPTADAPLRVYLAGDSIIHDGGLAFIEQAADDPLLDPHLHYENATGLVRPDFYDWPTALRTDATTYRPEIAVVMFGGNDAQGIRTATGKVFQDVTDPGWQREYARRVGFVMDELRAEGRVVLWIGLPPMRSAGFEPKARIMSSIYEEQAAARPWVRYVDTTAEFGDAQGRYVQTKPGPDGEPVDLRKADGVHFNLNGAERFARYLRTVIDDTLDDFAEPAPTPSATGSAP